MTKADLHKHLSLFKQGNIRSFECLYNYYHEKVYYFCLSLTKSSQDAEEITADVFVKLWERRRMVDEKVCIRPLLFKITRDLTWNFLKKMSKNKVKKEKFLVNCSLSIINDSENNLIFDEYMKHLEDTVGKLSPQQARVFTLRFLQGMDLNDIARELQISKNTVKVHLSHSKRFVLDHLPLQPTTLLIFLFVFSLGS